MTRADDLPQTVAEATASGWRWITGECRSCRHRGQLTLAELPPTLALAAVARKMVCRSCRGRRIAFELSTYLITKGGQPWQDSKRIAFEGERAVRPRRD